MTIDRRQFLDAAAAALSFGATAYAHQDDSPAGMPTRPLGTTGERVSILGVGGWHLSGRYVQNEATAVSIVHAAIDEGITFMDNAWCYGGGKSEERMGKALSTGGRREKVFLMTKVCSRDYEPAKKQLETSLRRLKTDHLDLWQFHNISHDDDPELIFDPERGAIRATLEAKQVGKIRYIGFTSHFHSRMHKAMLQQPLDWAAAQLPLNVLDILHDDFSFEKSALPAIAEAHIGILGMKAFDQGRLTRRVKMAAEACLRYNLSLPVSTQIVSPVAVYEYDYDGNAPGANWRVVRPTIDAQAAFNARAVQDVPDGEFYHEKVANANHQSTRIEYVHGRRMLFSIVDPGPFLLIHDYASETPHFRQVLQIGGRLAAGWDIDRHGGIRVAARDHRLYRYEPTLDEDAIPVWGESTSMAIPAPFTEVRRIVYDTDEDAAYLVGFTKELPAERKGSNLQGYFKKAGKLMARYDNWSTTRDLRWSKETPWDDRADREATNGIEVEGDYVFAILGSKAKTDDMLRRPIIFVYKKASGEFVGTMQPGGNVGDRAMIDMTHPINVHRRACGEYVILCMDDAYGKNILFRWRPDEGVSD